MAILIAIIYIGLAVIIKVLTGAFHSIVEAAPFKFIEFLRRRIPWRRRLAHLSLAFAHEMRHGHLVATAEALAVAVHELRGHLRPAELVVVVHVRTAVGGKISLCGFNAIVKATALNFVEFLRRSFPSPQDAADNSDYTIGRSIVFRHALIGGAPKMGNSAFIPASKTFAIGVAQFPLNTGVTEFFTVVDIGAAVIVEVFMCTF
jgi:hypothetical protein